MVVPWFLLGKGFQGVARLHDYSRFSWYEMPRKGLSFNNNKEIMLYTSWFCAHAVREAN